MVNQLLPLLLLCLLSFITDNNGVSAKRAHSLRVKGANETRKDYKDIRAFDRDTCGQFKPKIREQDMVPVAFRCKDDDESSTRRRGCGRRSPRLGGGWLASQAFKSHVIINFSGTTKDDELKKWRCSGIMIDYDMALTAQSCIDRPDIAKVGSMTLNYDDVYYGLGYCILDGFKVNSDKTYNNDIGIVRFNTTREAFQARRPECVELDMKPKKGAICLVIAEGDRTRDDDDVSAKNLKTKALFIENDCPTEAAKKLTHSDQTCWRPYIGAKGYEGNLCESDKGSPVLCMDHCGPGLPRFVLVGLVSAVVPAGKEPIAANPCDRARPHPEDAIIVTNLNEISEKLTSKLSICLEEPVQTSRSRANELFVI